MDDWSPIVAAASDNDRSSSEGEYTLEPGAGDGTRQAGDGEQQQRRRGNNVEGVMMMDDGGGGGGGGVGTTTAAAAVGFGISGTGEGKVVLGRVGQRDDKELRYLHLLWEPGRAELGAGGVASKLGKVTGSRARRQHRVVRNLGPIGKDIYGEFSHKYTN